MNRIMWGIASLALAVGTADANAQFPINRNYINNSGNGAYNTIIARNRVGSPYGAYGGYAPAYGGYAPGYGGYAPAYAGYAPSYGGYAPSFGGGIPYFGGVNVNVITNSGNGYGNVIKAVNRGQPGGLNFNFITNSGNGVGNVIQGINRGW
jgi:hypothetical protein